MKKIILSLLVIAAALVGCQKPYVIVQVADPQLGFDADVKFQESGGAYVDDLTYEVDYLNKAVAQINLIKPDAVVFTGDNVHQTTNEHQWYTFISIIGRINSEIKTFFVPGNHDVLYKPGSVDIAPYAVYIGEERFVFSERGVKMVGLNTNLIKFDDSREQEQLDWLKGALKKEKKSDVTLVFGHHPFFKEDIDEDDGSQIQKAKRRTYFDLFKSKDVDAVYAGHLHAIREGEYEGIPMRTMTAAAYQLGEAQPSIRIITVSRKGISDEIHLL
jgi:3',5'-cyclic AMP phosphodiesterase CpdA